MENKEQVYSMTGCDYYPYEYLMSNLRDYYNIGESVEVWEADKKEWRHSDFVDVETIRDDMQVAAMDECGEVAEEYLDGINREQLEDLRNHIAKWFNENAKINFYGVENEHKIMVTVE